MSRISVELVGEKKLQQALAQAAADVKNAAEIAVVGTALELRGNIVKSIARGPASGRVYEKYNPRRTHQASARGEFPMTDTGRLANSIYFERLGSLTAAVGSTLAYAVYLEYKPSNVGGRPFFRPAVEEIRPIFMKRIEKALGDELR